MSAGATLGRYRLESVLGRGGMGTVWRATHTVTGRSVAIKVLDGLSRRDVRGRFVREARASAAIDHPAIVPVHDVLTLDDGTPALVMDLLCGETLRDRLDRAAPLAVAEAGAVVLAIASAIGAAHARGIVHRDLKPENVFLVRGESDGASVRVLDFGVAKVVAGTAPTTAGVALGTPAYMAPEQALGGDVDHRADVFALGVILYEVLSGNRPIEGKTPAEITKRLLEDGVTPLEAVAPDAPAVVCALTGRMLARAPEDRPALVEIVQTLGDFTPYRGRAFDEPGSHPVLLDDDEPLPRERSPRRVGAPVIAIGAASLIALAVAVIARRPPLEEPTPRPAMSVSAVASGTTSAAPPVAPIDSAPAAERASGIARPAPAMRVVPSPGSAASTAPRPSAPPALPSAAGGLIEHPPFLRRCDDNCHQQSRPRAPPAAL